MSNCRYYLSKTIVIFELVASQLKQQKPVFETLVHSGSGKAYCPLRIRDFIPGEMGLP